LKLVIEKEVDEILKVDDVPVLLQNEKETLEVIINLEDIPIIVENLDTSFIITYKDEECKVLCQKEVNEITLETIQQLLQSTVYANLIRTISLNIAASKVLIISFFIFTLIFFVLRTKSKSVYF
jgi:hypothetical protein